jgi:hypothetical protein
MTEEQFQSSDGHPTNGIEDNNTDDHDDEIVTSDTSAQPVRRSRFFRSKRKQRLNEEQVDNNSDVPDGPVDSSESPGETI